MFISTQTHKGQMEENHRELLVPKSQSKQKSKCIVFCLIFVSSGQREVDCTYERGSDFDTDLAKY